VRGQTWAWDIVTLGLSCRKRAGKQRQLPTQGEGGQYIGKGGGKVDSDFTKMLWGGKNFVGFKTIGETKQKNRATPEKKWAG